MRLTLNESIDQRYFVNKMRTLSERESAKEVAKDIEFGVYPTAIDRLKREFNKSESRSQSQCLIDVVKQQASTQAQLIESSLDKLKPEMSYRRILAHEQTFRGIPLPKTLAGIKTELSQSAEVKAMLSKSK